ncbi:hypothetical protein AAMO2058_001541600 [Amorphochlora amoebiformis]
MGDIRLDGADKVQSPKRSRKRRRSPTKSRVEPPPRRRPPPRGTPESLAFVRACAELYEEENHKLWASALLKLRKLACQGSNMNLHLKSSGRKFRESNTDIKQNDSEGVWRKVGVLCKVMDGKMCLSGAKFQELGIEKLFGDAILVCIPLLPSLLSAENNPERASLFEEFLEKILGMFWQSNVNKKIRGACNVAFQLMGFLGRAYDINPSLTLRALSTYQPILSAISSKIFKGDVQPQARGRQCIQALLALINGSPDKFIKIRRKTKEVLAKVASDVQLLALKVGGKQRNEYSSEDAASLSRSIHALADVVRETGGLDVRSRNSVENAMKACQSPMATCLTDLQESVTSLARAVCIVGGGGGLEKCVLSVILNGLRTVALDAKGNSPTAIEASRLLMHQVCLLAVNAGDAAESLVRLVFRHEMFQEDAVAVMFGSSGDVLDAAAAEHQ